MAQINAFFNMLHEYGGSDLHLASGSQPLLRLRGQLTRIKYKTLEHEELKAMLYEITPEAKVKQFEETGDVDFAHELPGVARYRVNFFMVQFQKNQELLIQTPDSLPSDFSPDTQTARGVCAKLALRCSEGTMSPMARSRRRVGRPSCSTLKISCGISRNTAAMPLCCMKKFTR